MKKVFLLLLMSFIAFSSMAQFGLGIKAGANFATLNSSGGDPGFNPDWESITALHAGLYANYFFGETIGIQPEILFSQKGSKVEDIDLENKLTYIDIPILLRVQFLKILSVHAGPQFSFLTSAKSIFDGDEEDISDQIKSLDTSLAFGAGVDLPLRLHLNVRYIMGLSNIADDADFGDIEIKNNMFQASLGFRIIGDK
jgi:hypothetical protein